MFIESPLHLRHCSRPYIGCCAGHCPDFKGLCVCAESLSHIQLCATPGTVVLQAHLSMGFSRQEDWSGLPYLSAGDLPNRGKIKPRSPALQVNSFTTSTTWEALKGLWKLSNLNIILFFFILETSKFKTLDFWLVVTKLVSCRIETRTSEI